MAGAYVGATGGLSRIVSALPGFFAETQGKLLGAIVFAATSGIFWYVALGIFFFLTALLINLILSLIGGLKFVLTTAEGKKIEPPKEKTKIKDSLLDL